MGDADADARSHKHFRNVGDCGHAAAYGEGGVSAGACYPRPDLSEYGARNERTEQPLRHSRKRVDEIAHKTFFENIKNEFAREFGFYLFFLCG